MTKIKKSEKKIQVLEDKLTTNFKISDLTYCINIVFLKKYSKIKSFVNVTIKTGHPEVIYHILYRGIK